MEHIVFSQRGLSYVSRINRCLTREMGFNFKLSEQSHLLELLQISSVSPIDEIQRNFRNLLRDLEPDQKNLIENLGVNLPELTLRE